MLAALTRFTQMTPLVWVVGPEGFSSGVEGEGNARAIDLEVHFSRQRRSALQDSRRSRVSTEVL